MIRQFLTVNLIYNGINVASMTGLFNRCADKFKVFSCFVAKLLRLISGAYMLEINKPARWILL